MQFCQMHLIVVVPCAMSPHPTAIFMSIITEQCYTSDSIHKHYSTMPSRADLIGKLQRTCQLVACADEHRRKTVHFGTAQIVNEVFTDTCCNIRNIMPLSGF